MKELSIEEKAKRYDEAVINGSRLWECGEITMENYEYIFPELKESEDEKIRKDIVEAVELHKDFTQVRKEHIYAWLKKQDEHKKFRDSIQIGDKVTRNQDGVLVNLSQLKRIAKPAENKGKHNMGISEATKKKLEDNLNKALEKETPESCNEFLEKQDEQYYSCESDIDFKIEADKWYVCIKDYYYSDIDELMFTKGKAYKAYIDWGFISNNGTKKTPIGLFPYKEYFRPATDEEIPHDQKPAELNDDDKQYLLVCKNALYKYQVSDKWDANIIYQWLEDKVKSSVQQSKQEWSEEDEDRLNSCVDAINAVYKWDGMIAWLKSLKERYAWKPSDEHYELEEFAKIVRGNLTGISKAVQELFKAKYLQLTGNKMYGGFKD